MILHGLIISSILQYMWYCFSLLQPFLVSPLLCFFFSLVQINWDKPAETKTLSCWLVGVALNPTESQRLMFAVLIDSVDILLWKSVREMFNNPAQLMMLNMYGIIILQQLQFCLWIFLCMCFYLFVCVCVCVRRACPSVCGGVRMGVFLYFMFLCVHYWLHCIFMYWNSYNSVCIHQPFYLQWHCSSLSVDDREVLWPYKPVTKLPVSYDEMGAASLTLA